MKKLKELLKETFVWERQFGEKLPTLADVQEKYEKKQMKEWAPTHDDVGGILADVLNELEDKLKKLNKDKAVKWGKKYNKSAKSVIENVKAVIQQLTRIR